MKFLNFNTTLDEEAITSQQMTALIRAEKQAAEEGKEIYVALIHNNFENNGSLLAVICPINFYDKQNNATYKYQANFLYANDKSFASICGMYLNLEVAKFHVESFYGCKTQEEISKKGSEIGPRIEAIEKSILERTR